MKKLVNSIIVIVIFCFCCCALCLPIFAQMNEQKAVSQPQDGLDQFVKASPFVKDGINAGEIVPRLPPPPAVSLPLAASMQSAPMSLSWRSRALVLANEYPLKKNSSVWTLPVDYKKGQMILKQAVLQNGLNMISEYDDAGQFLIAAPESNKKGDIIIVSQPVSETRTLFKMHTYSDNLVDNEKVSSLPETMKNLLENRALWQ